MSPLRRAAMGTGAAFLLIGGALALHHATSPVAARPDAIAVRDRTTHPAARPVAARARRPVTSREAAGRSAARLLLVGFGGAEPDPAVLGGLARHEWGGVVLQPGNGVSLPQVASVVSRLRAAATAAGHRGPLIAAVQGGGPLDAVPAGPPAQPTATDAAVAHDQTLLAARALHAVGVQMALGPIVDVGAVGIPSAARAFPGDAVAVGPLAAAAVHGWRGGSVAPAPGRFPGEGAASGDPALGPATVGLSPPALRERDIRAFLPLISIVPAVQLSAASYVAFGGATPATLLPVVVHLLRDRLGFRGVVVSGDLAAAALATHEPMGRVAVRALLAGCDLLFVPGDAAAQEQAWRGLTEAIRLGKVGAAQVRDALARIDALRAAYDVQ